MQKYEQGCVYSSRIQMQILKLKKVGYKHATELKTHRARNTDRQTVHRQIEKEAYTHDTNS
jgi:hypothetical protein